MERMVVLECYKCGSTWTDTACSTEELEDFVKGYVCVECQCCGEWQGSNVIEEY